MVPSAPRDGLPARSLVRSTVVIRFVIEVANLEQFFIRLQCSLFIMLLRFLVNALEIARARTSAECRRRLPPRGLTRHSQQSLDVDE